RVPGQNAFSIFQFSVQWNTANGSLGLFLDSLFCFGSAIPMRRNKTAFFVQYFFKFTPGINSCYVLIAISLCLIEHRLLDIAKQGDDIIGKAIKGNASFFLCIPSYY